VAEAMHASEMMVAAMMSVIATPLPRLWGGCVGTSLGSEGNSLTGNLRILRPAVPVQHQCRGLLKPVQTPSLDQPGV
jgi:hypothetical protein